MTKNDAYLYSKKVRRKSLTHAQLEVMMTAEGYSEDDIKLVKAWLGNDREYLAKFK